MSAPIAIASGIAAGLIGSLPPALMLERVLAGKPVPHPVPVGIAILVPLVLMCVSALLVRQFCATMLATFALAMIATLIVVWAIEAVRACLDAQRGTAARRDVSQ